MRAQARRLSQAFSVFLTARCARLANSVKGVQPSSAENTLQRCGCPAQLPSCALAPCEGPKV